MEQNIENVEVTSSILVLSDSFDFGDNIKRAAPIIHARERMIERGLIICPGQVSNILELTNWTL